MTIDEIFTTMRSNELEFLSVSATRVALSCVSIPLVE